MVCFNHFTWIINNPRVFLRHIDSQIPFTVGLTFSQSKLNVDNGVAENVCIIFSFLSTIKTLNRVDNFSFYSAHQVMSSSCVDTSHWIPEVCMTSSEKSYLDNFFETHIWNAPQNQFQCWLKKFTKYVFFSRILQVGKEKGIGINNSCIPQQNVEGTTQKIIRPHQLYYFFCE